ncbi:MAG: InlB B-repeat-containing protein, partial [Clostridia bacterium]
YCFSGNFDYAGYKVTNIYYEGSAVVGNVETKYELFFGLLRDEEDNVLANVTRWIPSESWVATGNIELIPHEIADDTNSAYLISNPMQLAYLADVFNGETAGYVVPDDFSGKTFKLGASIDLSNYLWNPIGTTSSPFNGKFYGNGYTISGIVVTEGNNGGLFGVVKNLDTKVKIENFEISEVNIRLDSIEGTRTSIGMLASSVENAQIKFIKTSGFIKSDSILTYSVGGLVGFATTTSFFACQSFAEISATQKSVQTKVTQIGGLVGYGSNVVINNSFFAGSINGIVPLGASTSNTFSMGGLLGFAKGISSTSVVDSFNAGVITANVISGVSYSIGGIVGEINSLTDIPNPSAFKKCYYFSNLTINNGINAFGIYPSGWIPPQSCVTKTDINFFKSSETYSNSSNWEYLNSWDFDTVWNQVINEKSEFPTLQAFGSYGIIANNTEVVGGRLIFANEDGELVENLDPESKIVERKYRYQDNVQFYVEVDEHYSYGKNVKLDGVTLQNAIVWETLTIGEIVYDAFTISVNSNTCGSYSVEFTPAYYTLSISVEEDIEGALGGYIKFDNSDKFSQRDYDVSYLRTFILTAEPKTDYAFVGWFKSVLVVVEEGAEPPIEPTYELVLVSDSNEPLTVTMQGENATYVARFTKNICNLTIVQIGGEGGIFSFRDGQPSETVLVGKMLLNAEGKVSLEVKDGYTFVGWFINENDAEPVSTELDYIMEYTTTEYTLYAKFIPPEIVVENNPLTIILIIGGGVLLLAIIVIIIVVKKKRGGSNYRNNFNF